MNPGMSAHGFWRLAVVKKFVVGLSGLGLVGFLVAHVTGNFLLFVGPQEYNLYGHALVTMPIYPIISYGLLSLFILHAVLSLFLAVVNRRSRPTGYAVTGRGEKGTSLLHKSLPLQGILFIAFIVLHLISFKYGPVTYVDYNGEKVRDLFSLVATSFKDPIFVGWYVFCLIILALHIGHGFASSLQTLGFGHPRMKAASGMLAKGLAIYVSVGFILQPIYMFFFYQG